MNNVYKIIADDEFIEMFGEDYLTAEDLKEPSNVMARTLDVLQWYLSGDRLDNEQGKESILDMSATINYDECFTEEDDTTTWYIPQSWWDFVKECFDTFESFDVSEYLQMKE